MDWIKEKVFTFLVFGLVVSVIYPLIIITCFILRVTVPETVNAFGGEMANGTYDVANFVTMNLYNTPIFVVTILLAVGFGWLLKYTSTKF